jgi:hypothetical protein
MASKSKAARKDQKVYWEKKLDERLSALKEKGANSESITKDTAVRKIRAKIREATSRLKAISEAEKKLEDMARRRAEKAATPKKEKGNKEKDSAQTEEMSKRQQKKRKKREEKQDKQEAD